MNGLVIMRQRHKYPSQIQAHPIIRSRAVVAVIMYVNECNSHVSTALKFDEPFNLPANGLSSTRLTCRFLMHYVEIADHKGRWREVL